jgi:oligoribonuclease (3'-5' exoribonuclease)
VKFAGLDIETTGVDASIHRLIQLGIAVDDLTINIDVNPGECVVDPQALEVNKFTPERIAKGITTAEADDFVATELELAGYTHNALTPVGWNVGGFDMVFLKREFPKTARYFAYRTLDLTGVAIMHELRTGKPYRDLKTELAAAVATILGRDQRHDALYDAQAALEAMRLLALMDGAQEAAA